ncbi:MAG: endonuclease [Dehalococcoidia bacterium]
MKNQQYLQNQLRQGILQRVGRSKKQRLDIAQRYTDGNYAMLTDPKKTINRLNAKGQRQQAVRLAELSQYLIRAKDYSREDIVADPQVRESNRIVLESLVGNNEILSVQFLHRGSQVAQSIGRIVTIPHHGANGTGFLISSRLLMTNHHVLSDEEDAAGNIVEFDYGDAPDSVPIPFRFRPDEFFRTSPIEELDCTVVAVEALNNAQVPLERFGWCVLAAEEDSVQIGERVNIIHHPAGAFKQVSIRDNFVANEDPEDDPKYWHYSSDTRRGSSGSPVFNEEWEVVALHHAGIEVDDPEEVAAYRRILQTLGVAGLDATNETIQVNEGIRAHRILDWLQSESANFTDTEAALYQELVERAEESQLVLPRNNTPYREPIMVAPRLGSGEDVISVPLAFNFYFGSPLGAQERDSVSRPAAPRRALPLSDQRTLELYKNQVDTQKSVFTALSFLQGQRESDYLPTQQAIQERQREFYGDLIDRVADDELSPAALYDELNDLSNDALEIVGRFPESMRDLDGLVRSHRGLESMVILESDVSYARARAHLYTKVDLQPERMLRCPYTKALIAPEQLMLLDLIRDLGQFDLLPQRYRNNRYLNCEHIVPQAWFKDDHPKGVSDLHHLIAADGGANNYRSDCPYRELNEQGALGPEDNPSYIAKAGRKHNSRFEPANGKEIVARATLYFIITYKGAIDKTKYDQAAIEVLKKWAKGKAPSDYERHRNEGAFEAQGNRNPLIDFPAWIDKIDFNKGLAG